MMKLARRNLMCWTLAALVAAAMELAGAAAGAQGFDATSLKEPVSPGAGWLVQMGDDAAFARADFDDSRWTPINVRTQTLPMVLPGKRAPVMWYRLHMKVAPNQTGLAVEQQHLAYALEMYANGQMFLQMGSVVPYRPYTYLERMTRRIPDDAVRSGSVVLALRVAIDAGEWGSPNAGLYYTNLTIGQEHELHDRAWMWLIGHMAARVINRLFLLGLGLVALTLFLAQRSRREYLWIFIYAVVSVLLLSMNIFEETHDFPAAWELSFLPVQVATVLFLLLLYLSFLRIHKRKWIWVFIGIAVAMNLIADLGQVAFRQTTDALSLAVTIPEQILLNGVIPALLLVRWRRGNREAGLLFLSAILYSLGAYVLLSLQILAQIPSLNEWSFQEQSRLFYHPFGPFTAGLLDLGTLLFNVSLTVIVVLRSLETSRQQAMMDGELAAARGVQHVLLPEKIEAIPGFVVETAYESAEQVGGDFFQVLPAKGGGMLLVVGDVAGKGLPAAMLVSVVVGAVRGVAEYTEDPAELLANLNERLVNRGTGGFSTALVAKISAEGDVEIANAGHLPPYLNGAEVEMPGALPLGVLSGTVYESFHFRLELGSRLTFYSDGVVEATNRKGELFGFERTRAISRESAAAILQAAKAFGQADDITVITLERSWKVAAA